MHLPVVSSKQRKGPQNILQQQYYPDININQDIHVNGQYKPETEAEITMNELWIARRRQEVNLYLINNHYKLKKLNFIFILL